jgi:hypothetical protein
MINFNPFRAAPKISHLETVALLIWIYLMSESLVKETSTVMSQSVGFQ